MRGIQPHPLFSQFLFNLISKMVDSNVKIIPDLFREFRAYILPQDFVRIVPNLFSKVREEFILDQIDQTDIPLQQKKECFQKFLIAKGQSSISFSNLQQLMTHIHTPDLSLMDIIPPQLQFIPKPPQEFCAWCEKLTSSDFVKILHQMDQKEDILPILADYFIKKDNPRCLMDIMPYHQILPPESQEVLFCYFCTEPSDHPIKHFASGSFFPSSSPSSSLSSSSSQSSSELDPNALNRYKASILFKYFLPTVDQSSPISPSMISDQDFEKATQLGMGLLKLGQSILMRRCKELTEKDFTTGTPQLAQLYRLFDMYELTLLQNLKDFLVYFLGAPNKAIKLESFGKELRSFYTTDGKLSPQMDALRKTIMSIVRKKPDIILNFFESVFMNSIFSLLPLIPDLSLQMPASLPSELQLQQTLNVLQKQILPHTHKKTEKESVLRNSFKIEAQSEYVSLLKRQSVCLSRGYERLIKDLLDTFDSTQFNPAPDLERKTSMLINALLSFASLTNLNLNLNNLFLGYLDKFIEKKEKISATQEKEAFAYDGPIVQYLKKLSASLPTSAETVNSKYYIILLILQLTEAFLVSIHQLKTVNSSFQDMLNVDPKYFSQVGNLCSKFLLAEKDTPYLPGLIDRITALLMIGFPGQLKDYFIATAHFINGICDGLDNSEKGLTLKIKYYKDFLSALDIFTSKNFSESDFPEDESGLIIKDIQEKIKKILTTYSSFPSLSQCLASSPSSGSSASSSSASSSSSSQSSSSSAPSSNPSDHHKKKHPHRKK